MLTDAEERQILTERICDHLIDRDDYANLDAIQLFCFLEWALEHHADYTDIDGLEIDIMFEAWLPPAARTAA